MIYVDDVGIPARVWNKTTSRHVESRWYHLITDEMDPAELHAFAARLGLRRSYFQPGKELGGREPNPGGDHYDLTEGKRKQAIALGAKPVTGMELTEITIAKRHKHRRSLDSLCPACVHPLSEHMGSFEYSPQPSYELLTCQNPTCDCEIER